MTETELHLLKAWAKFNVATVNYVVHGGVVAQVAPSPVKLWDCKASSSNPLHVENTLDTTCTFNAPRRHQDRSFRKVTWFLTMMYPHPTDHYDIMVTLISLSWKMKILLKKYIVWEAQE